MMLFIKKTVARLMYALPWQWLSGRPRLAHVLIRPFLRYPTLYLALARKTGLREGFRIKMKEGPHKGHVFTDIDLSGLSGLIGNYVEPNTTALVLQMDLTDSVVIDVGAANGYYTLLFARGTGENGLVYSFEPDIDHFFPRIRKIIADNGYANVILLPYAISNGFGISKWVQHQDQPWCNQLIESPRVTNEELVQAKRMTPVLTLSLDDFAASIDKPRIRLIKIDVESLEVAVMKGAVNLLETTRPTFLIELHTAENATQIYQMLAEFNYEWSILDTQGDQYTNIVAFPVEHQEHFQQMIARFPTE